jgi:hypothetical protein
MSRLQHTPVPTDETTGFGRGPRVPERARTAQDLDPYAVAYASASLLNNLFGRSKEPFWQQAYTDLLKFVISLRRITDGYTTLAEVYHFIIEEGQIEKNIRTLKAQFDNPPHVLAIAQEECQIS